MARTVKFRQTLQAISAPMRAFWVVEMAATLLCAGVMAAWRLLLHYPNPYRSPFFPEHAEQKFLDFYDFSKRFSHYHQLDFFSLARDRGSIFSYPPPAGLIYAFFYLPRTHRYLFFTAVTVGLACVLVLLMAGAMRRRGVGAAATWVFLGSVSVLSYPFWFNFLLGNIEICVFLLLAFGMVALVRGRSYAAAAMFGIAGSVKLFPFILFGLLLSRRQYRQTGCGMATAALAFLFATWMECPSLPVAREGMAKGAAVMGSGLILRWLPLENGFDHSLFSLYKTLLHGVTGNLFSAEVLHVYVLAAACGGMVVYGLRIRRLPFLNQVLCLYVAAVLLPPMSHHYTLLHLYVPWALLTLFSLDRARAGSGLKTPGLVWAMVWLALLLAPEAEFIVRGASLSGPIKTVELCILGAVGLTIPFGGAIWREQNPVADGISS